jgi:hypothetical protein
LKGTGAAVIHRDKDTSESCASPLLIIVYSCSMQAAPLAADWVDRIRERKVVL